MKWTKKRVALLLGVGAFAAALLFPSAPLIVVGWLHGEPTYYLLPARYWREELRRYHDFGKAGSSWLDKARDFVGARRSWQPHPDHPLYDEMRGLHPNYNIVPILLLLADDPHPRIRWDAFQSLEHYPESEAAIAALMRGLDDPEDPLCWNVVPMLGRMGPPAKAALPRLRDLMSDKKSHYRGAIPIAALAVWQIEQEHEKVTPVLLACLQSQLRFDRGYAMSAIAEMGPVAQAALPELRKLASDDDEDIRSTAVWTIGKLGDIGIPVLLRAAYDKSLNVRRRAIEALGDSKLEPAVAVAWLRHALLDPELGQVTERALQKLIRRRARLD